MAQIVILLRLCLRKFARVADLVAAPTVFTPLLGPYEILNHYEVEVNFDNPQYFNIQLFLLPLFPALSGMRLIIIKLIYISDAITALVYSYEDRAYT
jgi:hypothetical protein